MSSTNPNRFNTGSSAQNRSLEDQRVIMDQAYADYWKNVGEDETALGLGEVEQRNEEQRLQKLEEGVMNKPETRRMYMMAQQIAELRSKGDETALLVLKDKEDKLEELLLAYHESAEQEYATEARNSEFAYEDSKRKRDQNAALEQGIAAEEALESRKQEMDFILGVMSGDITTEKSPNPDTETNESSHDPDAAAKADANGAGIPSTFASPAKNPAPAEKPKIGAAGEAWQIKRGIRPGRGPIEERRIVPPTPESKTDTPSLDAAAAAAAVANAEAAGKAPAPKTETTPTPASGAETTPEKTSWLKRIRANLGGSALKNIPGINKYLERKAQKDAAIDEKTVEYKAAHVAAGYDEMPFVAREKAKKDYKTEKRTARVESVKNFVDKHKLSEEDKAVKQAQIDRNKAARQARKDAGETKFGKVRTGYVAFRERGRERFGVNPTPDTTEIPADETPTEPIPAQEKPVVYDSSDKDSVTSPMDETTQAYPRPEGSPDTKVA